MPARRRSIGWIALAALFLFMGFVVYRSFHLQGVRCEVCLTFNGVSQCRTVEGELEQDVHQAALTNACAEEALQQIRDSTPFTGSGNLTLGQGACSYTVTSQGAQNRTITASGTVGTIIRKVKVIINKINPQITVTSWQEMDNF